MKAFAVFLAVWSIIAFSVSVVWHLPLSEKLDFLKLGTYSLVYAIAAFAVIALFVVFLN